MSFFNRFWNAVRHGEYADTPTVSPAPAAVAPSTLAPPPVETVAAGAAFPNRAAFDAWLPTTTLNVGLDYKWVKQDGVGGVGFYTQPDGSITKTPPVVPLTVVAAVAPPTVVAPVAPDPPPQVVPSPAEQLQPLTGDLLRDVLFLCAVSNGGPLTPAYQRASAQLGDHLHVYINAYKGQVGNYDFFKPMEHTGMALNNWDPSRTPPNYVRAIGGMTPEQFDSIKPELVALGYAVS